MATAIAPSGLDLKVARIRAGVTATALAARLGVSRQRIVNIEGSLRPSSGASERYLQALAGDETLTQAQ